MTSIWSNRNSIIWIITGLLAIIFVGFEFDRSGDFVLYFEAASQLFISDNIYNDLYGYPIKQFFYYGSPLLTLLIYPFKQFSIIWVGAVWKLLNLLLFFRIWKLLTFFLPLESLSDKRFASWVLLSLACVIFPIYSNLHYLQFTIVILYCALESMHQIFHKQRPFWGTVVLAMGIFIKVMPIVLVPYLIYRKRFKALGFLILSCILIVLSTSFFLGWEANWFNWQNWLAQLNLQTDENVFDMNNRQNNGLRALLASLFVESARNNHETLEIRRHILNLNHQLVHYLIAFFQLLFASFTLYFLRTKPFKTAFSPLHRMWELSYILLAVLIIFPQQRPYNFVLLLPAIGYTLYYLYSPNTIKKWVKVTFVIAILVFNLELILGEFRDYYWYFKTMSYASFLMVIVLSQLNPIKDKVNMERKSTANTAIS